MTTKDPAPTISELPELPVPCYWWEPTPESGLLKSNAGWSENTGPAPGWLVTAYFTAAQMRDYVLADRAARRSTEGWVSVEDRFPPAAMHVLVYGRKYGMRMKSKAVFMTFISTRPRECVEDEEITHWQALPVAPKAAQKKGQES